jgi:L-lactate dehydrogenase complex protein LldE
MRVALFVTCINDALFPHTGKAVVALLERLGHTVEFPARQTCCGQMHYNNGYHRDCLPLARSFVDTFADCEAVVMPSGSCTATVRHAYRTLADKAGDNTLAARVGQLTARVHELSEFLVDVLQVDDVGAYFPHRVVYHPTCHSLRALRVGDRPLRLLRNVRGIDLVPLPQAAECCGFGGTFALKNSDLSVAMCADKVRHVRDTGADVLCASDNSCLTNIGGMLDRQRSGVRWMHLAEILAGTEEQPA